MTELKVIDDFFLGGLIKWFDIPRKAKILCVNVRKPIVDVLRERSLDITEITEDFTFSIKKLYSESSETFDIVILYDVFDYFNNVEEILRELKKVLINSGRLLVLDKNNLAIRRFCGAIEDIPKFSQADYRDILLRTGYSNLKFYSIFPSMDLPQLIYAEDYYPNESMQIRYIPKYLRTDRIFFQENRLCDVLAKNKVLHQFANAYAIECSLDGKHSDILSATLSMERGCERALITVLYRDRVEKRTAFPKGTEILDILYENQNYLKSRDIATVDYEKKDGRLVMPYIDYPIAIDYLAELASKDKAVFLERMDQFYNLICRSSETIEINELGPILKKGFIDLVPSNCFWDGNEFVVFDQEYCQENIPARLMMLRTIIILFEKVSIETSRVMPDFLYDRYGITGQYETLRKMEREFIGGLAGSQDILDYIARHVIHVEKINENFKRIFE